MIVRTSAARSASTSSLRARAEVHAKPWDAIDVFDLANTLGVEVRFVKIPSMEGMYLRQESPVILIASQRPPGRQRYTCAHELGHHIFKDGSRIDELLDATDSRDQRSIEEVRAEMFAGLLLMPKTAVHRGFAVRNIDIERATAVDVFRVACWLGVGYTTLLKHLKYALHIIAEDRYAELLCHSPKSIRTALLGRATGGDLIIADEQWDGRSIDVRVGDRLLLPEFTTLEGRSCVEEPDSEHRVLFKAVAPGIGRFESRTGWSAFVRVSRENYEGRSMFRHLEEVEDD